MEGVESTVSDAGALSAGQWQLVAIAAFVVALVAFFYFARRLYKLFQESGKSTYKPNIGRARMQQDESAAKPDEDA